MSSIIRYQADDFVQRVDDGLAFAALSIWKAKSTVSGRRTLSGRSTLNLCVPHACSDYLLSNSTPESYANKLGKGGELLCLAPSPCERRPMSRIASYVVSEHDSCPGADPLNIWIFCWAR